MALPFETLVLFARIAVGAAIVAAVILAARGALRMLLSGELRLLLRGVESMPSMFAEAEDSYDGPQNHPGMNIVYCRSDGRARLAVNRRSSRH